MPGALSASMNGAMPPAPVQPQQQGNAPQMPAQAPAPSHAQTVAALRHFDAILGQLTTLLKNPDLGKADMKSNIIDGMTKLVADRMIAPTQAVDQLSKVPDRPFDQKKWTQERANETMVARNAIIAHHAAAFAGAPAEQTPDNSDDHMNVMQSMMQQHYGSGT